MRNDQVLGNVKDLQEKDRKQKPNLGSDLRRIPRTGTCVVFRAQQIGQGSYCAVNLLGNGQPTSVRVYGAFCHDAVLSIGDTVQYQKTRQDKFVLISGSLSETTITNIINEGGGTATNIFYPDQFFSIFNGGVRGPFDGS